MESQKECSGSDSPAGLKAEIRLPKIMDGYATKTGQDSHVIHGLRTSFEIGHKEACPVSGRMVSPPLFLPTRTPVSSQEVCQVQVPDSPALKVFEQSMRICNKIVDAALRQGKTVLSKIVLNAVGSICPTFK